MDKPNTQSVELIVNDVVITFSDRVSRDPDISLFDIEIFVTGYKMTNDGVYFLYDKAFAVNGSVVNRQSFKKLFFVPYANIISIETALENKDRVTDPTENTQTVG